MMSSVYVYVGAKADVVKVALDLRNQAPAVLIVCCSDEDKRQRMETALSEEAVGNGVEWEACDGGSRRIRKSAEDFQARFKCVAFKELIVAGRQPVVKEVNIKETLATPGGGALLIAELGLHAMVQGQLYIRFAAFALDRIRGGGSKSGEICADGSLQWAKALEHESVRLMAGEFGAALLPLLATIRKRMTTNVCAYDDHAQSAMLMAGPVGRVTMLGTRGGGGSSETRGRGGSSEIRGRGVNVASLNNQSYGGEEGKDETRGWPVIGFAKQKEATTVLPHTRKLSVFFGSNTTHRTPTALAARGQKRQQRTREQQSKPRANKALPQRFMHR